MSVFEEYACYYEALYHDKDYRAEVEYITSLMKEFAPSGKTILELGCGTGEHALLLGAAGYDVSGIDLSPQMIRFAEARRESIAPEIAERVRFRQGDARLLAESEPSDVVLALFHVLSYQTENSDVEAVFTTAAKHLKAGGLFVFDCWYGPAVLTVQPSVTTKRVSTDEFSLVRIAEPKMLPRANIVEVHYQIDADHGGPGKIRVVRETHRMRYFFEPEIERFLAGVGMRVVRAEEWLSGEALGTDTWGACVIAVKE
jgi:SAM-dependent methyltransferase